METTILKVVKLTIEQILNRIEDKEYNPKEWDKSVNRYAKYPKCQFYVIEPGNGYSYPRFFASYIADGIYFFSTFSPFGGGITNNGFYKVIITPSGDVMKSLFKNREGKEGYVENCKENRQIFRDKLTPFGIMVSNEF